MDTTFETLGLAPALVATLKKRGIETPTPIQARVFAPAAEGKDILAKSQTGSGKTLAFGLPLLGRMDKSVRGTQMLVLTPTRELAAQVAKELEDVARVHGLSVAHVIGGASMRDQMRALKSAQVVVGTPGRIIDHLDRGTLKLDLARAIVLDEGDEMLDMGFLEDILKILEAFPDEGQRLLFSATVPPAMRKVIADYLRAPVTIETQKANTAHSDIKHVFYGAKAVDRYHALANVLLHEPVSLALVFTQTKQESQDVALRLAQDGFSAAFINGDLSQDQRNQVMESFRAGRTTLLIATDVAARGIDVQGVSHVINYSLPWSLQTYTHRSGRTGRAGATGVAISIVSPSERFKAQRYARDGHFEADWRDVPTQTAIEKVRTKRLRAELAAEGAPKPSERSMRIAKALLEDGDPLQIVAALVERAQAAGHHGYEVGKPAPAEKKFDKFAKRDRFKEDRFDKRDRTEGGAKPAWVKEERGERKFTKGAFGGSAKREKEKGMDTFRIQLGERQQMSPGALIQMICRSTGLKGGDFGRISIQTNYTFFDVKSNAAPKLLKEGAVKVGNRMVPVQPA